MTRLFVAVWPPPEVVAVLSALERPALPEVRWSVPEQWMVKLRPLGHVDGRLVPPLVAALREELDGAPAADCVLGPATRRLPRPAGDAGADRRHHGPLGDGDGPHHRQLTGRRARSGAQVDGGEVLVAGGAGE